MPVSHSIEVYNSSDELIAIFDKWQGFDYDKKLNRPTTATFTLDANDPKATDTNLAGGQNYIKYKRGSQVAWSGEIIKVSTALKSENEKIQVTCGDWFYLLKDRYVTAKRTFSSTNEGTILWTLIDESQSLSDGDFGITQGVNNSTTSRDRTYKDKNIQQAIIQMTEVINGVDVEITADRVFNVYDKKSTDRSSTHVFEYGVNVQEMEEDLDWTNLKNDLKAYGGDGISRDADDAGSKSTYKRRQDIVSFGDVILNTTLDRHLDEILRTQAIPTVNYKMTLLQDAAPLFGTYEVGDIIRVKANQGFVTIDANVRIYGWSASINNDGEERIELHVSIVQ